MSLQFTEISSVDEVSFGISAAWRAAR